MCKRVVRERENERENKEKDDILCVGVGCVCESVRYVEIDKLQGTERITNTEF